MTAAHTDGLALLHHLTDRDWQLFGWLYDHRVLTTPQIANALFPSLNFAQRRLATLTGLGLLARFRPFRLHGGTHPYHYTLAHTGAVLITASRGLPPPRPSQTTARLQRIATSRHLDHQLGINQFFTDLHAHTRRSPGSRLDHWWPDTRLRSFAPPGINMIGTIRSDSLGVWTHDDHTVAFYFEHDTGTENLTILADKLRGYHDFHQRGGPAWPVLFWLPSTIREAHLHQKLTSAGPTTVPVATAARDRLNDTNPAGRIWQIHGRPGPLQRLANLPMPAPVDLAAFTADDTLDDPWALP
jgi:hypothetical protein